MGTETKFDQFGGDYIENARKYGMSSGVKLYPGQRFCETCKQRKPKGTRPAIKGWKCDDCIEKTKKV